jgi:outer membrane protein assembly factor BamA
MSLARIRKGWDPYVYRLEFATTTTLKSESGTLKVPFQDDYVLLSLPHLLHHVMALDLRASFTREATQKYYGIGNATSIPSGRSLDDPSYEYTRTHPTMRAEGRVRVAGPFWVLLWLSYTQNWLDVPPDTKLALDATKGAPAVRSLIPTLDTHGVMTFSYGVAFDTRNDKVSPTRGQYHETRIDLSPGGTTAIPHHWGAWDTSAHWYFPIGADGSAFALRLVSDLKFGDAPFYELYRFDQTGAVGTGAFGGPSGVRGVPAQRYGGKIKFIGNLEVRKMLFRFRFLSKDNGFGVVAFFDTGRVFATYESHPELDGTSLGLKLGAGAGLRLVAGKSFVLRADVGWSPDARPISAYVAAGQAF